MLTARDSQYVVHEAEFTLNYCRLVRQITFAGLMTLASFALGLANLTTEDNAIWFQRSGSLIVAFALLSKYLHLKLTRMMTETPIDYGPLGVMTRIEHLKRMSLPGEYSETLLSSLLEPMIIMAGLLGAVILGYGDLIYRTV